MHTGMLWFDNSKDLLAVKIGKAADYYEKKYGRRPDLVLVHPSMLDNVVVPADNKAIPIGRRITIRPYRPVLPGHIWIGIEDKEETPKKTEESPAGDEAEIEEEENKE